MREEANGVMNEARKGKHGNEQVREGIIDVIEIIMAHSSNTARPRFSAGASKIETRRSQTRRR